MVANAIACLVRASDVQVEVDVDAALFQFGDEEVLAIELLTIELAAVGTSAVDQASWSVEVEEVKASSPVNQPSSQRRLHNSILDTLSYEPRRSWRSCSSSRSMRLESSRLFAGTSSFGRERGVSSLCRSPRRRSGRRRSSVSGSLLILLGVNSSVPLSLVAGLQVSRPILCGLREQPATHTSVSSADRADQLPRPISDCEGRLSRPLQRPLVARTGGAPQYRHRSARLRWLDARRSRSGPSAQFISD